MRLIVDLEIVENEIKLAIKKAQKMGEPPDWNHLYQALDRIRSQSKYEVSSLIIKKHV